MTPFRPLTPIISTLSRPGSPALRSSRLTVDPDGSGAHLYNLDDETTQLDAWSPPVRRHWFADHELFRAGDPPPGFEINIRQVGSLPQADQHQLDAMLALPRPNLAALSTRQMLRIAEEQLHAARPQAHAALPLSTNAHAMLASEVTAAARRLETATTSLPDDAALKRRAAEVARIAATAVRVFTDLAPMMDRRQYLGGAGDAAVRLVTQVANATQTALFASWADRPGLLAGLEERALRLRLSLPHDLAGALPAGGSRRGRRATTIRAASGEFWDWRGRAGLGAERVSDRILRLRYASGGTGGSVTAGLGSQAVEPLRESYYQRADAAFESLVDLTTQTQREAGLFSLLALWAQMTWYERELDSWIDSVAGAMPGTRKAQRSVAQDYRDKFLALVVSVETAWKGSWTAEFGRAVDGVLQRLVAITESPDFKTDIEHFGERLTTIEVVRLVGKVLAIMAVAALTAWAASAGTAAMIGSAARGLSLSPALTASLVRGGAFVAEVTVFTAVNRAGNAALLGGNTTTFLEDWGTNFLMFRLLRFTSGLYAARWSQLARLAHPVRFAVGQAGVNLVALHAFAEIHEILKHHTVMSGEERFRAVFTNVIMTTTFALGQHIVTAPEARIPAKVLAEVRRQHGDTFVALEDRRKELGKQLEALRRGDPSADLGDVLRELESLYAAEFGLISRVAQQKGFTPDERQAALDAYARPIRGLEIEFARMGLDFGVPESQMYRPLGAQIVEFRAEGLRFLKEHYASAKGQLIDLGDGMWRGTIQGETVYWIRAGSRAPVGAMRGTGVLPLGAAAVLQPSDMVGLRAELIRIARHGVLRFGTDFGAIPFPDSRRLAVPRRPGSPLSTPIHVTLDIEIATPTGTAAHGTESGPARNHLTFELGEWRAKIQVDPRLSHEDALFALMHEVNEVAGIARRLDGMGLTGRQLEIAILRQQQAAVTREGARAAEATEHDLTATADLISLFQRWKTDQTPANRAALDAQIRQMGFAARYFAQELVPLAKGAVATDRKVTPNVLTRDEIVRQVAVEVGTPTVAEEVLRYVDRWRTDTAAQTPFVASDRPDIATRLRDYVNALAGRRSSDPVFGRTSPEQTLDLIEMVAQAALGQPRLTVEGLVAAGIERALAQRIVTVLRGGNPYRTLYAELESMIALRHRIAAEIARGGSAQDVGYGFVHELTAVQQLTAAGHLDGASFGEVIRRLQVAHAKGLLVPVDLADPLRPRFGGGTDATSSLRMIWRFRPTPSALDVDSLFSIDLPGQETGRPFQLGDTVHADFEPAQPGTGHGAEHVSETGVVVPAGSAPAHIWVVPDAAFKAWLDAWGKIGQRRRFIK